MFSAEHFIWLAISAVICTGLILAYKKFKFSFNTVLTIMIVISILSEVVKILCNMQDSPHSEGGKVLDPGDLPFHLCSMQIFLIFILKFIIKSDSGKEKMLAFMSPTMLIGAVAAFFVPTVGTSFTNVQVYQYFIYHSFLVFFSVYILSEKFVKWNIKAFFRNLGYLGLFALICTWINSALIPSVDKINFMYLVRPPMQGLPLINLDNGWAVYFITLAALAVIFLAIFHTAASLPEYIKNKKSNATHSDC